MTLQHDYDKLLREYRNVVATLGRIEKEIDQHTKRTEAQAKALPIVKEIIKGVYDAMLEEADDDGVLDPEIAKKFPWTVSEVGAAYHSLEDALQGATTLTVGDADTDELRDEFEDDKRIQKLCDEVDRLRAERASRRKT